MHSLHKFYKYFAWFILILTFVVIALGAWTRLVDAGLGCPDWPGCYGFISVPDTTHEIAIAESRFPDAPVEVEKGWPEMIHRYFAGVLGLCIFALAGLSWRLHRHKHAHSYEVPVYLASFLAFWVVCQALFGLWTVTLKLWPQVVSVHLLGGMVTLCGVFLLLLKYYFPEKCFRDKTQFGNKTNLDLDLASQLKHSGRFRVLCYCGFGLLVLQIALGGWLSSNYAALICPDFPYCQGRWWPEMDFSAGFNLLQPLGINYLGGQLSGEARTAIHYSHRILALVIFLYFIGLLISLFIHTSSPMIKRTIYTVAGLLGLQIVLGITNVVAQVPLSIAVMHNLVAALLLLSMIFLIYLLSHNRSNT